MRAGLPIASDLLSECRAAEAVLGSGMLARAIAKAREVAGLSREQFAALLELSPSLIQAWETGAERVDPAQLDVVARLFGLDGPELLTTDLRTTPSALLYRSMAAGTALERFASDRLPHQLGEFQRCVRILAECEKMSGTTPEPLTWLEGLGPEPLPAGGTPPYGAVELAARVRARLGLGLDPIPSMQKLLREHGVALFFADPDTVHPAVDAACTLHPRPAILVNVTAGGDTWWRTRMSLAHELAHLCFDRDVLGVPRRLFLFSPAERWQLFDRFEAMEQRASAFAAYFLAPPAAVQALVPRASAASPAALYSVVREFGVGHETAANILKNVFALSDVQRGALLAARPLSLAPTHPDRVVRPRLRDDAFVTRVLQLYRDEAIDGIRARRWLRLAAHEPLPTGFALSPEQRAPILSPSDRARQRLDHLLRRCLGDASLHVDAIEIVDPGRIRVFVVRSVDNAGDKPIGHVVLGADDMRVQTISGPDLAALAGV